MILQKQICEVGTPFWVDVIRSKILIQPVRKYFVRLSVLILRLLGTNSRTQFQIRIHVSVYRRETIVIASALKIYSHAPIAGNAILLMIDFLDLILNLPTLTCSLPYHLSQ